MELINIKCHDLKHWFKRLQSLSGSAYEKEAKEIQKALAIYDSMFQTGNKILDTILTEKKLYCEYNKINDLYLQREKNWIFYQKVSFVPCLEILWTMR